MDIVTALAFGYVVYSLIYAKKDSIDDFLLNPKHKIKEWINRKQNDDSSTTNH